MKKIIFTIAIILINGILYANTLTIKESIKKTLLNHPDIKSFMLKIKQSQKSYQSANADNLPQINLQAGYNITQTYPVTSNNHFKTINDNGWSMGISLKQKIWDFKKTKYMVEAFKFDEDISKLSLKEAKNLLAYKVKSLYELMVVQKEAIKVREKDLESKQALYLQAKAMVKHGLKTKADESRFLSAFYQAKNNLTIAKTSFTKAKDSLSLYMGEKIPNDVKLQTNIIKQDFKYNQNIEKEILKSNYQIKIQEQNIQKNNLLHKSSQASKYGSVNLIASYNRLGTLNNYDSKLIGLTLSIPLYSGGRLNAQEQKARLAFELAKEQKNSKILELKDEIESLLNDIKEYKKTIKAKKAQLFSANETKKVIEGRYKVGLATYVEVLDSISVILNAKLGVLEAYYAKSMAIARLKYLKGEF